MPILNLEIPLPIHDSTHSSIHDSFHKELSHPSRPAEAQSGRSARFALLLGTLLLSAFALAGTGCATVQPWERGELAGEAMQSDVSVCHRFEHNNEVYREGAVGANGGKSGGGCGCT